MLDIHCHILPGVDDGPRWIDESMAMLQRMQDDGVTHVIATSHCNQNLRLFRGEVVPQVERLNAYIKQSGLSVTVLPGSEIALCDVEVYRRNYEAQRYCHLGDRPYYSLLEFPWQRDRFPEGAIELISWLREQGTTPILAHPERTPALREDLELLTRLVEGGAWMQITVDSFLGNMSTQAGHMARDLMETFPNVVLASDSHNLNRCSGLSVGYKLVRDEFGPERESDLRERANRILQQITNSE